MAAGILEHAGVPLVHNQAGANMAGGVATALLAATQRGGGMAGELGLFEVDELWLDAVAAALHPRVMVLANLFRDQLDRYGELEAIVERWSTQLRAERLVLNADDPLIADLGRERPTRSTTASRTTRSPCARWRTQPTRSTAAAAARRTCSMRSIWVTSATTTARAVGSAARRPP